VQQNCKSLRQGNFTLLRKTFVVSRSMFSFQGSTERNKPYRTRLCGSGMSCARRLNQYTTDPVSNQGLEIANFVVYVCLSHSLFTILSFPMKIG
jgi:hypothetical protein